MYEEFTDTVLASTLDSSQWSAFSPPPAPPVVKREMFWPALKYNKLVV